MTYKKKLIEVALPLDAINSGARRDKGRSTGTIRSLHKWFAPMPTAAVRALIAASLIDAPATEEELAEASRVVAELAATGAESPSSSTLERARQLIEASCDGDVPTIADPFSGGGSTAVESQRLGLNCFASDLNPVPVLITRAAVQSVPAFQAPSVLERVSSLLGRIISDPKDALESYVLFVAERIYLSVRDEIGDLYVSGLSDATALAWRWTLTVPSPDPQYSGIQVPLARDYWFSRRQDQFAYAEPVLDEAARRVDFVVRHEGEPSWSGSSLRCCLSKAPLTFDYLREMGQAGHLELRCMGEFVESDGRKHFVGMSPENETRVLNLDAGVLPSVPLPDGGLGLRIQAYGYSDWTQLFTPRQLIALKAFAHGVRSQEHQISEELGDRLATAAVMRLLGLSVGRLASQSSGQTRWRIDNRSGVGQTEGAYARAAVPMMFDFAETNPFGGSSGDWMLGVKTVLSGLRHVANEGPVPRVEQLDARSVADMIEEPVMLFTDPPYFDQIGYADLSDFFYPWIRMALRSHDPDLFSTVVTPKIDELIADPDRHGGVEAAQERFGGGFRKVFTTLSGALDPRFPMLIVYAQRQQEKAASSGAALTGWEAMLQALLDSGLQVVGTWPIHGTGSTRQRAQKSSALSTYILMVCRPQPDEAPLATRTEFVATLRSELPGALLGLQRESIAPVDLAQSAIGPGMAVFSRYSRVIEADGSRMSVRQALASINEVLQEVLSAEETEFDGDTRWALTWFEQFGLDPGPFGAAETLSKAKTTSVAGVVQAGIAAQSGGNVRLLDRSELDAEWDPTADSRLTVWEVAQYLVVRLDESEIAAADLLRRIGSGMGDRARMLAYLLFQVSDRKGWSSEAVVYNSLVQAWPEIARLAAGQAGPAQQTLGE